MLRARTLRRLLPIAALPLLLICMHTGARELSAHTRRRDVGIPCDAANGGLTLPPGFCALVVAENVGLGGRLAVTPDGTIYVALDPARDGSDRGGVLALRDRDGDGRADEREILLDQGDEGVAHRLSQLFFGANESVPGVAPRAWEFAPVSRLVVSIEARAATLSNEALFRPYGAVRGSDGSLYVNDQNGRIYRILYLGL